MRRPGLYWLLVALLGCQVEGVGSEASTPGQDFLDAGIEAGLEIDTAPPTAPDTGAERQVDTRAAGGPDVQAPLEAQAPPDATVPPDTAPECPTVTVQRPPDGSPEGTRWAATVQATSTDGFCFKTCDTPIFGVTWKSFSGRTLTVNGNAVYLVGVDGKINADTGTTETPPSAITGTGLRTFQVSAGASASASFTWSGGSIACP